MTGADQGEFLSPYLFCFSSILSGYVIYDVKDGPDKKNTFDLWCTGATYTSVWLSGTGMSHPTLMPTISGGQLLLDNIPTLEVGL